MGAMTPWVTRLLIANVVIFLIAPPGSVPYRLLYYFAPEIFLRWWSPITYMFLHGGFRHLLFNMIGLFFFGPRLEERMGGGAFLGLYFAAGLGGALAETILSPAVPMVGASAGVYGVLLGYAYYWPRVRIVVFPIPAPLEARTVIGAYMVISLVLGIGAMAPGIAHWAHLGGAATAFLFLKIADWRRGSAKREFQRKLTVDSTPAGVVGDRMALARWQGISVEGLHELNREEVKRLLDKAGNDGPSSLTASERQFLDRMARG